MTTFQQEQENAREILGRDKINSAVLYYERPLFKCADNRLMHSINGQIPFVALKLNSTKEVSVSEFEAMLRIITDKYDGFVKYKIFKCGVFNAIVAYYCEIAFFKGLEKLFT